VPGLRLDLRYATANNFTGRALYPVARCLLRTSCEKKSASGCRQDIGTG
jgi:D-alanyl-D-alanine dipeptidase